MKFIFDQLVKVNEGFFIGQLARTRAHFPKVKGKKSEDPNIVDEDDFEGYTVELVKFPGNQIQVKGTSLDAVYETSPWWRLGR